MTTQNRLVTLGVWSDTARVEIIGDYVAGITVVASGNNVVAGATPVPGDLNFVATSGVTTNSMILQAQGAAHIIILNQTANAVNVFPPTGGTINAAAANASFPITAAKSCQFFTADGVTWVACLSA